MFRLISFFVLAIAIMTVTIWAYNLPGGITIELNNYRVRLEYAVVIIVILSVFLLSGLLWLILYAFLRGPRALFSRFKRNREKEALDKVGRGFLAIAAGDISEAERCNALARKRIANHPVLQLLSAQIAESNDDSPSAKIALENLLGQPGLDAAGRRGLYLLSLRGKNYDVALEHASAAFSAWPKLDWAAEALFSVQCRLHDWQGALDTIDKIGKRRATKLFERSFERLRAVLLTAKGMELPPEEGEKALELFYSAWKLDNSLVPAAVFGSLLMGRMEKYSQAEKVLRATWKKFNHPDVAETFIRLKPGMDAKERFNRAKDLIGDNTSSTAAALGFAQAAHEANEDDIAEQTLLPHSKIGHQQSVCLMLAEIIGKDSERASQARQWINRLRTSVPDPKWISDGIVSDNWSPLSPITAKLDEAQWRSPQQSHEGLPVGLARLTPVVDKIEEEVEATAYIDKM